MAVAPDALLEQALAPSLAERAKLASGLLAASTTIRLTKQRSNTSGQRRAIGAPDRSPLAT